MRKKLPVGRTQRKKKKYERMRMTKTIQRWITGYFKFSGSSTSPTGLGDGSISDIDGLVYLVGLRHLCIMGVIEWSFDYCMRWPNQSRYNSSVNS